MKGKGLPAGISHSGLIEISIGKRKVHIGHEGKELPLHSLEVEACSKMLTKVASGVRLRELAAAPKKDPMFPRSPVCLRFNVTSSSSKPQMGVEWD